MNRPNLESRFNELRSRQAGRTGIDAFEPGAAGAGRQEGKLRERYSDALYVAGISDRQQLRTCERQGRGPQMVRTRSGS